MLKVLKSGFYTSIQDEGRFNYRNKGVPISGAMDLSSAFKANTLLENDTNSPVLEITMTGPTLVFEEETYIVIAGATMSVMLNNQSIQNYKVYQIDVGDMLSYGKLQSGFRGYLAIKGGFEVKPILGSTSFYAPVSRENRLQDGDILSFNYKRLFSPKISEIKVDSYLNETILEVDRGPEYELLNNTTTKHLLDTEFTVSKENNRVAYRLKQLLIAHTRRMQTSATLPGTVQLTPNGELIILMKDGQTTGSYPRILQLTDDAICILAQKKEGDLISFKLE